MDYIENIEKEVFDFKKAMIISEPNLLYLMDITPEELAKKNTVAETKKIAKLLDVKTSGKEIDLATRVIDAYLELNK